MLIGSRRHRTRKDLAFAKGRAARITFIAPQTAVCHSSSLSSRLSVLPTPYQVPPQRSSRLVQNRPAARLHGDQLLALVRRIVVEVEGNEPQKVSISEADGSNALAESN